jgi:hypothetical protein
MAALGYAPVRTDVWTDEYALASELRVRVPIAGGEGARVGTVIPALERRIQELLAEHGLSCAADAEVYLSSPQSAGGIR